MTYTTTSFFLAGLLAGMLLVVAVQQWFRRPSPAQLVCWDAYQVVGSMLSDLGQFGTEHADKILDNLSQARIVHDDVLPWPSFEDDTSMRFQFRPASEEPQFDGGDYLRAALILNPCDGLHLVYAYFLDGEFDGFTDFASSDRYEPHKFFIAWALLPDEMPLIERFK